jgi:hypothetical protein
VTQHFAGFAKRGGGLAGAWIKRFPRVYFATGNNIKYNNNEGKKVGRFWKASIERGTDRACLRNSKKRANVLSVKDALNA